ncbi:MAG: hypothetical protein DMG27_00825 [Acidobacteria bacterium]|nr:MAG: hypothetical protein DMG27_00825 [Acidobacteriota bacterium]
MESTLNPKLLDVVKVPNEFLGLGSSGTTVGTVVEVLGVPPQSLLVEVADQDGVPSRLVSVPISQAEKVWSFEETEKGLPPSQEAMTRYERGMLLLQNGLLLDARSEFQTAFQLDPSLAGALMNSANDLARRASYDAAIQVYELILELQPQNSLTRENLAATHINRGVFYGRNGALDKAIEDFNACLLLNPSHERLRRAQRNLVAVYTQLGLRLAGIRRYEEALGAFAVALQIEPAEITRKNLAVALVSLMASRREGGRQIPPIYAFRRCMYMGLTYSECLNAYGATLASLGDMEGARRALEAAVQADPRNELAEASLSRLKRYREGSEIPQIELGTTALEPQTSEIAPM